MPTITTGLTYTLSGLTMPIHPDPKTVEQWCTENSYTYAGYTTETYANHVPGKSHRMYATYEASNDLGYAPTWTGTTVDTWGFRWAAIDETLVSVTVS